jgi:hypothetical protein
MSIPEGFTVVGNGQFNALAATGDYAQKSIDVLHRREGETDYFVMRESENDRLERIRAEVEAEIRAQEAELLPQLRMPESFRGM